MNKVALVTGSSRGIGRAVALRLAREGYAVCVNCRQRIDLARQLAGQIGAEGGRAIAVQADVSDRAAVDAMVEQVRQTFGPVTLLVNNAGVAGMALFQDVTDELWDRTSPST